MVTRIVGYSNDGKKVFDRPAREYDSQISKMVFGITMGDAIKAGSVIALGIMLYANQMNFNTKVLQELTDNASIRREMINTLSNINVTLSLIVGKPVVNGLAK